MKSCRECVHSEPALLHFIHCHYPIPSWMTQRWGVKPREFRIDPMNAEHCSVYQPREEREAQP